MCLILAQMLDIVDHLLDYTTTLAKPELGAPENSSEKAPDNAQQLRLSFSRSNSADIVDLSVVMGKRKNIRFNYERMLTAMKSEEAIASLMSGK